LNNADRALEAQILEGVEEQRESLAEEIRRLMFVFEDLMGVDDRGIMSILKEVSTDDLKLALKTASEELQDKIFGNMSSRAVEMLKEDMEIMGPTRLKDVEIGGGGEDEFV
jgi:flagellar motor switch protein FliG